MPLKGRKKKQHVRPIQQHDLMVPTDLAQSLSTNTNPTAHTSESHGI